MKAEGSFRHGASDTNGVRYLVNIRKSATFSTKDGVTTSNVDVTGYGCILRKSILKDTTKFRSPSPDPFLPKTKAIVLLEDIE
jgi:hypothetical protein